MIALEVPVVLAPLAGGPSTPQLAAGVSQAGGLGFLAAGYRTPDQVRADLQHARTLTDRPLGVGLFAPPRGPVPSPGALEDFRDRVAAWGPTGEPRRDDDHWQAKLDLAAELRPEVVSVAFGCPAPDEVQGLREAGCEVWVTVTDPAEARAAAAAGATGLVVQGIEAGGHRGSFTDEPDHGAFGLLALLALVRDVVELPLVATGGIADGRGVAAVLAAGATAAQLGTAFLRTPEAGTSAAHREALARDTPTRVTRAFTGKPARGLVNRFLQEHDAGAPAGYPEVHHLTAPLRAAARAAGDPEAVNLWAGQAHRLAQDVPAAELVRRLGADARDALARAADVLGRP